MRELKVGDIVKTVESPTRRKDRLFHGMKILRIIGIYAVVDNKKDIGDGVIGLDQLELDIDWYREHKLERIMNTLKSH